MQPAPHSHHRLLVQADHSQQGEPMKKKQRRNITSKNFAIENLESRRLLTTTPVSGWNLVSQNDSSYTEIPSTGPQDGQYYSLRALIEYYNSEYNGESNEPFTITLGNGTYTLSETANATELWSGRNDNANQYGDLDINPLHTFAPLIIQGSTSGTSVITCDNITGTYAVNNTNELTAPLDRLIQVISGSVQLQNVTLKNGLAWDNGTGTPATDSLGGAVLVNPGGTLSLTNCNVSSNAASATLSTHAGSNGLNAAGGGIYGSAGSVISLNGFNTFSNNRVIAGRGSISPTSTGLKGGNSFGAGIAISANVSEPSAYSSSQTLPSTEISFTAQNGSSTSFNNNRLNSYVNGNVTYNSGGTGGAASVTGGAGGNAYGAGLYVGPAQLNIDGGSSRQPIKFSNNTARGGSGYTTSTIKSPGANGIAYGAGAYLSPGQVSVANSTTSIGILQFNNNEINGNLSTFALPEVTTVGDVGYTTANGPWNLRTAFYAASQLVASGMNLTLNLPTANISIAPSTFGNNTGGLVLNNSSAGLLTIAGSGASSTIITGSNITQSIFQLNNSNLSLSNLSISEANSTSNGGAINQSGGSTQLSCVTLSNNKSANGGAIYSYGGQVTMTGGSATGNAAPNGSGGAFFFDGGMTANLNNVNISNNQASTSSGYGGAILQDAKGVLNIQNNSIIQNNKSAQGGGVYGTGNFTMSGGKIIGNTATQLGGGLVSSGGIVSLTSVSVLTNSVISNSVLAGTGGGIYQGNASLNLSGSTLIRNNKAMNSGGLFTGNSNLTATNTKFIDNTATNNGGGLGLTNGGVATLNSVQFSGNQGTSTSSNGGGIFQSGGTINVKDNSTFSDNKANNGGAVYAQSGTFNMTGGTVNNNNATGNGGGLCSWENIMNLSGVVVENNTINSGSSTAGWGAGLYQNGGGEMILANMTVKNNSSSNVGGGLYAGSNVTISNSKFHSNSAAVNGGGILASSANLQLTNVSVSSNSLSGSTAGNGGGLYVASGTLNINGLNVSNNSITSNNNGTIQGAGIYANSSTLNFLSNSTMSSYINNNSLTSNGTATGAGLYLANGSSLIQDAALVITYNTIKSTVNGIAGAGVGGGIAFGSSTSYSGTFPAQTANIADYGFESPSLGSSYIYNPTGTGWTFTGYSGITGNKSGFTSGNPNAPQGTQVAFIQKNCTATQTISGFNSGSKYYLSFYAAQRAGYPQQSISVSIGSSNLGTITPTSTSYHSYSIPFTASASGSLTLTITGLNPNNTDETVFIDDIVITQSAFSNNSASAGGNDIAFVVTNTTDSNATVSNGPAGISTVTSSSGSLRGAISYAQNWMNSNAAIDSIAIMLTSGSNYVLSQSYGQLVTSVSSGDELTIIGTGVTATIQGTKTRVMKVTNNGDLVLQKLNIIDGYATTSGNGGTSYAAGGGIYQSSGTLTLNGVSVGTSSTGNVAQATWSGTNGSSGTSTGQSGTNGGVGENAYGGGIYLANGILNLLSNSYVINNSAIATKGGNGGNGANGSASAKQSACDAPYDTHRTNGGNGGSGGQGGSALGGGIYQSSGTLNSSSSTSNIYSNVATPGSGGSSGSAGSGGSWHSSCGSYNRTSQSGTVPTPNPASSGSAIANYDHAGGQSVFTGNATTGAQSFGGLYQASGSLNSAAFAKVNEPKRLPDVIVNLYSAAGKLITSTKTDQNGRYDFNSQFTGLGYVKFVPLSNYDIASKGSRLPNGVTSAFDSNTLQSDIVPFLNGVARNGNLNLILTPITSRLISRGNGISLIRTDDPSLIWRLQLMPSSYHGSFTIATYDINHDTDSDYIAITRTGSPRAFIVDGRTGQITKINGRVSASLQSGFIVQPIQVVGDSTKELILVPAKQKSGRISVIDLKDQKVLWNATDAVIGGMSIEIVGHDSGTQSTTSNIEIRSIRQKNIYKVLDGATGRMTESSNLRNFNIQRQSQCNCHSTDSHDGETSTETPIHSTRRTFTPKVAIPRRILKPVL